jgi:hypothetical protein
MNKSKIGNVQIEQKLNSEQMTKCVQSPPADAKPNVGCCVVEVLVKKGQMIQSSITNKILECYNVSSVCIGVNDTIVRYEYNFWDNDRKRTKKLSQINLKRKLNSVWSVLT